MSTAASSSSLPLPAVPSATISSASITPELISSEAISAGASCVETTLDTLQTGARCMVVSVSSSQIHLRSKLHTMGIVAGTVIEMSAIAPLRDPVIIKARGYSLSLRRSEASQVRVVPLAADDDGATARPAL